MPVLGNLSSKISECSAKAAECRTRANEAYDPGDRHHYLAMEARWLALARSYALKEMLGPVFEEAQRRSDKP